MFIALNHYQNENSVRSDMTTKLHFTDNAVFNEMNVEAINLSPLTRLASIDEFADSLTTPRR